MRADKQAVLKRLNYIEGHLGGIRRMVEEDILDDIGYTVAK